jgi:hypothetical protein
VSLTLALHSVGGSDRQSEGGAGAYCISSLMGHPDSAIGKPACISTAPWWHAPGRSTQHQSALQWKSGGHDADICMVVVACLQPGGERQIIVPPELGFGAKGVCVPDKEECLVPPNEVLKYDVILKRVAVSPI